jgi:hypothetical protein
LAPPLPSAIIKNENFSWSRETVKAAKEWIGMIPEVRTGYALIKVGVCLHPAGVDKEFSGF